MWWRNPWLRQRRKLLGLAIFDSLLIIAAYNGLFLRLFHKWAGLTTSVGVLIALWVGASYLLGRYSHQELRQRDSRRRLFSTLAVALLVLATVVVVVNWGLKVEDPRTFRRFLLPLLASVTFVSAIAQAWLLKRQQQQKRSFLIIGEATILDILRHELIRDFVPRELSLAYLPTDESPLRSHGSLPFNTDLLDDDYSGIAVSETAQIDDLFVQKLLAKRSSGTTIYGLVNWTEQHLQRVPPELFSSRWLVQAEGFELQPGRWGWRLKRLGDVAVAGLLLLLSAPLIALSALLIRLEDGGPILYSQERTGLYGEIIRIWKLRTMTPQAEVAGAQWASRGDHRITRIGHWLRKLRIDELPQLIAVLKGEMSLIGPRPERPEIELDLEKQIPHYRTRHWLRPGLSGWAQVCYPYGASIEDSRMKLSYDIFYLRNANLMLDLLILIKTLRLVSRGQGAIPQSIAAPSLGVLSTPGLDRSR
jgi:exopolysaccharide biosynthesis polyprenyl glycosylphosphotransferase